MKSWQSDTKLHRAGPGPGRNAQCCNVQVAQRASGTARFVLPAPETRVVDGRLAAAITRMSPAIRLNNHQQELMLQFMNRAACIGRCEC
jgi:hypothetical protein